jgi:hypothetical protein
MEQDGVVVTLCSGDFLNLANKTGLLDNSHRFPQSLPEILAVGPA